MVLFQKCPFFQLFFLQAICARKMSFRIFQNQKEPFQAIKTRSSKTRKIKIFPKGFCPLFQSKNGNFSNFFSLDDIGQSNIFYVILERKYAFLGYKNKKFKKSKYSHFLKGVNPWFFQAIKTKSSKSQKNSHFPKGVNPWFWSKNDHFSSFFFQAPQARKMSFRIFQNEKTPFQAIKTKNSKSRKIDIFPKRLTRGFGPKMAIFPSSFFRHYRLRKCFLRYSKTKIRFSRL